MSISRRQFLKLTAASGAGLAVPWSVRLGSSASVGALRAFATPPLSDPATQPKFSVPAPNALNPGFKYAPTRGGRFYDVSVGHNPDHVTGLSGGVKTPIFGYAPRGGTYTWPGMTFEVQSGQPITVRWRNNLENFHLLPVDRSLHWAYSLHGYEQYSIDNDGVPIVVHVHGGHTNSLYDGNPEYFFSPGNRVKGPQYTGPQYVYNNDQPAGTVWYHDHALGITRLNVYAGMAGFFIIRDGIDTGLTGNPLGVPTSDPSSGEYELAYAIQDRRFETNGALFYPAYQGDPAWDDFIESEVEDELALYPQYFGAKPNLGPSALAEFFGDHMVVNGKIWPKADVEQRNYRIRLLNGCDSRFLAVRFRKVAGGANSGAQGFTNADPTLLPFYVIGSDQGLATEATEVTTGLNNYVLMGPGERYDIVIDFSQAAIGDRIILENIGGDAPFGGDLFDPLILGPGGIADAVAAGDLFANRQTDRIMAFDVASTASNTDDNFGDPGKIAQYGYGGNDEAVDRVRKVALFEGTDEYGRLQPLLGTAEPATDHVGMPINWPDEPIYSENGLIGPMEGATAWHSPTTENPAMGSTEIWEIYNATVDGHPVHLHLVNFEILDRRPFSAVNVPQKVVQHNGAIGQGGKLTNIQTSGPVVQATGVEKAPKDMVTAYPGEMTRIKATFDKPGRYVWHCHILSHEDHEMMRVLHVGGGA
jgi:spore coat protein A